MDRMLTATEFGELLLEQMRQCPAEPGLEWEVHFWQAPDAPGTWRIMVGFGEHRREIGRVQP